MQGIGILYYPKPPFFIKPTERSGDLNAFFDEPFFATVTHVGFSRGMVKT